MLEIQKYSVKHQTDDTHENKNSKKEANNNLSESEKQKYREKVQSYTSYQIG